MRRVRMKAAILFIILFAIILAAGSKVETESEIEVKKQKAFLVEEAKQEEVVQAANQKKSYTDEDLYLLAKVIDWEARADWLPMEWKVSVGEVVLNRVASPEFPNTIEEVVYQSGQYGGSGTKAFANRKPTAESVEAARSLLEGQRILEPSVVYQSEFVQGSGIHSKFSDGASAVYFCYSARKYLYE